MDIHDADHEVVLSVIAEAELMVKPIRLGQLEVLSAIDGLTRSPEVRMAPVTREIARQATLVRARHNLKLEDSIIVASAVAADCDVLVGNDRESARRVTEIPYVYLDEVVPGA